MSLQFNSEYYLQNNPDVADAVEAGVLSAEQHWVNFGAGEDRNPNAVFNTAEYLAANGDVADSGMNPLDHFLQFGAREGRAPNNSYAQVAEGFDAVDYLEANEDVADAVEAGEFESAYHHWVLFGQFEGREATFDGGTPATDVITENDESDTGAPSELTEALVAYQAAEQAVVDYLESAPELDLIAGKVEAGEADATDISTNLTEAVTAVNDAFGTAPTGFADMDAELQDDFIAAEQALLQADVNEAKAGQPSNLEALLNTAEAAREARVAAYVSAGEANDDQDKVVAAFEAYHGLDLNVDLTEATYDPEGDYSDTILLIDGKFYVGQNGTSEAVALADLEEMDATNLQADVLAAIAASDAADAALTSAQTTQETAVLNVYLAVNDDVEADDVVAEEIDFGTSIGAAPDFTVDYEQEVTYATGEDAITAEKAEALKDALVAQQDFADAVADLVAARELNDGLVELQTAAEEARAAIENAPDHEDAPGLGISLLDFEDGSDATADSDLYVFADDEDSTITIANFGDEGVDRIFFGDDYNFVQLEDGQTIEQRVGSAEELEIFWTESDAGLILYVEADAEAGRDLSTDAITTIELTGVSFEDVNFADGFLSAGTAA